MGSRWFPLGPWSTFMVGQPRCKHLHDGKLWQQGDVTLICRAFVVSEKVFRPSKPTPNTASEGVWNCIGYDEMI